MARIDEIASDLYRVSIHARSYPHTADVSAIRRTYGATWNRALPEHGWATRNSAASNDTIQHSTR